MELATARTMAVQAEADEVRARFEMLQRGLSIGYVRGDLALFLQRLTGDEELS